MLYQLFYDKSLCKDLMKLHINRTLQESSTSSCVVQVEFAENYSCVFQDKVQSARWNQKQLPIFTARLWTWSNHLMSFAVVSDSTVHNKETALAYLQEVLHAAELSGMKELKIWSDVPSSQLKNHYITYCLPLISTAYHCHCSWNCFATSHGKGPVDGVGGELKQIICDMVCSRYVVVIDVE